MAYQIKKSSKITESLEFLDDNDNVALSIDVEIDVDKIAAEYRTTEVELMEYNKSAQAGGSEAVRAYGAAVVEFFNLIFGEKNTEKMVAYFDGKFSDMFIQTAPFIQDVIKPAIMRSVQQKRQMMASNMQLSRAQRRKLGL